MVKYKKGLMSLAAFLALSSGSVMANYIPITGTEANTDNKWVLFGVTGFQTSSGGGGMEGVFRIDNKTANRIEDDAAPGDEELFTEGLQIAGGEFLGKAKLIDTNLGQVTILVDTTDLEYKETEPVFTMYVTSEDGGAPEFAITYKATLEGNVMEYSFNPDGTDAHEIILNSANTYRDPGVGTLIPEDTNIQELTELEDIVDYNLSNNPPISSYYNPALVSATGDKDVAASGEYLQMYSYDAALQQWDFYDSRNSGTANTFETLEKGKGYWARMNLNSPRQAGFVLGSAGISTAEYQAAGLVDGWNLTAFSSQSSGDVIRHAATGLKVTLANAGVFNIFDSSANHAIPVDINATDIPGACRKMNEAVKQAVVDGRVPHTFEFKAFPTATASQVVMISNGRFMIQDGADEVIGAVTTLANQNPYFIEDVSNITKTSSDTTIGDLSGSVPNGAMSRYGEYALVIEPLVGVGTADGNGSAVSLHLQSVEASVNLNDDTNIFDPIDINTSSANVATAVNAATFTPSTTKFIANVIDSDYDGVTTTDKVLVASTDPFYIRDHTFTRVVEYNPSGISDIYVNDVATSSADAESNATLAGNIDTDDNNASAFVNQDGNIVITSNVKNYNQFDVTEDSTMTGGADKIVDFTTVKYDTERGAVKAVWSLDDVTASSVNYITTIDINASDIPDSSDDNITVNFKTVYGVIRAGTKTSAPRDGSTASQWATDFINILKAELGKAQLTAEFEVTNQTTDVNFTITSPDVMDINWTWENNDSVVLHADRTFDTNTTVSGAVDLEGTKKLIADLKYNPIFVPNYKITGPHYTMRDAGFELKAMVTGSTDLYEAGTGYTINWESIDLTRVPSEWLDSQDYSLFSTYDTQGYWAYLETKAETGLSVVNVTESAKSYQNHFNEDGTTYNNLFTNIEVEVDGFVVGSDAMFDKSAIVRAFVNSDEIELVNSGSSNPVYSGAINSFEMQNTLQNASTEILVTLADGLGSNALQVPTGVFVDLQKPVKPVVDLGDGSSISITSTSEDVAKFHIYEGKIRDWNTQEGTSLTPDEATAYNLCADTDYPALAAANSPAYALKIFAIDGTSGDLGTGNASDVLSQNYIPILKSSARLTDLAGGGASTGGLVYDSTCAEAATQPTDVTYGVELENLASEGAATIVYNRLDGADQATPNTIYLKGESNSVAMLTYSDIYIGTIFYIEVDKIVYSLEFPAKVDADLITSANPIELDTDSRSTKRADQDLYID